jgi:hypothetical protein
MRSLWLRFFLQTISIVWLEVEKHHFILIIDPYVNHISTYCRPNIHQNGFEILGVKMWHMPLFKEFPKRLEMTLGYIYNNMNQPRQT